MDDDIVIVSEDIKSPPSKKMISPFLKKTKQARLPFAILTDKQKASALHDKSKTRGASLDSKVVNVEKHQERKRKLSAANEGLHTTAKKSAKASTTWNKCHLATEDEVSSSCDENQPGISNDISSDISSQTFISNSRSPPGSIKQHNNGTTMLQKFVRREPTQQDEISTSLIEEKGTQCLSAEAEEKLSPRQIRMRNTIDRVSKFGTHAEINLLEEQKLTSKFVPEESLCIGLDNKIDNLTISESPKSEACLSEEVVEMDSGGESDSLKNSSPEMPRKKLKLDKGVTGNKEICNSIENKNKSKTNFIAAFVKRGPKLNDNVKISPCLDEFSNNSVKCKSNKESTTELKFATKAKCESTSVNESINSSMDDPKSDNSVNSGESSELVINVSQSSAALRSAGKPITKVTPKTLAQERERKRKEDDKVLRIAEKLHQKKEKEEEKAKKEAERLKLKKDKEDELKKQKEEKEQQREEKLKRKQEEIEIKNREREEKRLKMEEEKQKKEDEKKAKDEEKKRLEQEVQERTQKVAKKFANFFVANKIEQAAKIQDIKEDTAGPFRQMQVCRNTVLAPITRRQLSPSSRAALESSLQVPGTPCSTYLMLLRTGDHKPLTASATVHVTLPKEDKDDCVIIDEKDDDEDDEDEIYYSSESLVVCAGTGGRDPKQMRGKLLKFSENRRPPYWGTWSKTPAAVGPRRPFAKEEMFDYEYDSDDDWEEEEENGESLSDSEGEKDEEEDEHYEVDNEFFVPHGYLSDDEGQEDGEEVAAGEADDEGDVKKDGTAVQHDNKEKLKAKQVEFEKELKKQTKQLKPRVLGCLWLYEEQPDSEAAYAHLQRVLGGYRAVVCTAVPDISRDGTASEEVLPGIPCLPPTPPSTPALSTPHPTPADWTDGHEKTTGGRTSSTTRFYKTFPDEAVPSLIQLIHGNRHGKVYLVREFQLYWQQRSDVTGGGAGGGHDAADGGGSNGSVSTPRTCSAGSVLLSKKKIEAKIVELGEYKRCPEEGPHHKLTMWYVSTAVREQYGIMDATLPNRWTYVGPTPKEKSSVEDSVVEASKTPSGSAGSRAPAVNTPRTPAMNLITKFTKVLTDEEKAAALTKKKDSSVTKAPV